MRLSKLFEGDRFYFRDASWEVVAINRQSGLRCCKCLSKDVPQGGKTFLFYEDISV